MSSESTEVNDAMARQRGVNLQLLAVGREVKIEKLSLKLLLPPQTKQGNVDFHDVALGIDGHWWATEVRSHINDILEDRDVLFAFPFSRVCRVLRRGFLRRILG